ncbi:MAG: lytic transglycosylase domain-containing protein [Rhodanobacter sp.]
MIRFPLRTILQGVALACVSLAGLLVVMPAQAGSLYRCAGVDGEAAYTSSTAGYHGCTKISSFVGAATSRRATVHPPSRVTLTQVRGAVTTTARSLAADGSLPTTLVHAQGNALTNARVLAAAQVQHVSLGSVRGAVVSSAPAADPVAAAGTAGQWEYSQSDAAATSTAVASAQPAASVASSRPRVLRGAVYRIVRKDGSVEYTNLAPGAANAKHAVTMLFSYIATCAACDVRSPIRWGNVSLNLTAYADVIRAASVEYGVDEAFLRAIIHAESAFNPRALSLKGAQGLMQLMPGTASDMGVLDAFNTDQNIRGGARYLGLLLHDFGGNEQLAAAAYNAGPGAVQRYSGVPPYAETQVYVQRVVTLRQRYGAAIHPPLASSVATLATSRM